MRSQVKSRLRIGAKVFFIIGCAALAFVTVAIVRETQRRNAVAREIRAMEAEIARLEQQRSRLTELVRTAETPEFLEQEARLRLGLQKPGETVLIVPDVAVDAPSSSGGAIQRESSSNFRKWWRHIFR